MTRTLLDALAERFPDSSRTTLRQMLRNDRVRVNGAVERDAKRTIGDGDRVEVGARTALDARLRLLFEDDDLIVIDKTSGLLTVATDDIRDETAEALLGVYLRMPVHVVHRLDRDSSGVLVFAKNGDMRDRLQALFAEHDIERIYVAVVHGRIEPPAGTFHSFLDEDPRTLRVRSVESGGKEAITHYRTIAAGAKYSLLDVTLETGRRNQIRVHLSEAGHPIVGDAMYGAGRENPLGRLALHARRLGFVHPRTRRKVVFDSPPPPEFDAFRSRALQ